MIAYKLYSENEEGIPPLWIKESFKTEETAINGYIVCTEEEYNDYIRLHKDKWNIYHEGIKAIGMCEKIRKQIDDRTTEILNNGFVYQEKMFCLSLEDRMNYKADYDMNAFYSYSHEIKGLGETFLTFENREEHTAFILAAFIKTTEVTRSGWAEKTKIMDYSLEQLKNYEDIR